MKIFQAVFALLLLMSPVFSQVLQDDFNMATGNYWPGWTEVSRPIYGAGPRVLNGHGFIFVNGVVDDPALNTEHLLFDLSDGATVATAQIIFTNSAALERRQMLDDGVACLQAGQIYISNEAIVVTFMDDGDNWFGAFLGDWTLLDDQHKTGVEPWELRPLFGITRSVEGKIEILKSVALPIIGRFSPIEITLSASPGEKISLTATMTKRDFSVTVETEIDRVELSGKSGILYRVSGGWPCASFPQREIAVDRFTVK